MKFIDEVTFLLCSACYLCHERALSEPTFSVINQHCMVLRGIEVLLGALS